MCSFSHAHALAQIITSMLAPTHKLTYSLLSPHGVRAAFTSRAKSPGLSKLQLPFLLPFAGVVPEPPGQMAEAGEVLGQEQRDG